MANLKVLPLRHWMKTEDPSYRKAPAYLVRGRDGYYCFKDFAWWEYQGKVFTRENECEQFKLTLKRYDYLILDKTEEQSILNLLKKQTDPFLLKELRRRLHEHEQALASKEIRFTMNSALLFFRRKFNEMKEG